MHSFLCLAGFLGLHLIHLIKCMPLPSTIAQTYYGPIRGFLTSESRVFSSIPYAAPPIGDLRWVNPQPHEQWTEIRDCTNEVVGCPQKCKKDPPLSTAECPPIKSEDCLYLNVWTPLSVTSDTSSLPVLLFIHGGSFKAGYGGGLLYNGSRMANLTNSIVVTINYRLGALGSLWDPTLGLKGNYGFMDQIFAIEWTYKNIRSFGGDSERIILFGESAGAHSVFLHLMNTSLPIKGGIAQSPPLGLPLRSPESWGTLPITFSEHMGCDPHKLSARERLKCLREVDASKVVGAQISSNREEPQIGWKSIKTTMPWTPTVGEGSMIPEQPLFAFQKLNYDLDIPFMAGTNKGTLNLIEMFGVDDAGQIMAFYNISKNTNNGDLVEILGNIRTDWIFRCPTRNIMKSSVHSVKGNVGYLYHFNYLASYVKHVWYYLPQCWNRVCHTEELPLVFNPDYSPIYVFMTEKEKLGSNQMQFMWTNFAVSGNPAEGPHADKLWTKWMDYGYNNALESERTLMIDDMTESGIEMVNGPDEEICGFWDDLGYKWFNGTR